MEKRLCHRFNIPGTVVFYKKDKLLGAKENFPDEYFPVLDISRGGLRFLTNERPKIGLSVTVKLSIPDTEQQPEIKGTVQWISRNREESYRYQAGIAFNSYGNGKNENPPELLLFMDVIESEYSTTNHEESS